ncbi:transposase [candidate division KSB1 bacterium]|nr:transposase [candidate division KSB1 bacterium]
MELNVQADHVHVVLSIPSKYSVSSLMGCLKGQTFHSSFRALRKTREVFWGSASGVVICGLVGIV